jgi:hypothetical protein
MGYFIFPCLACLIIGALGGFAAGFRLAVMVLDKQQSQCAGHLRVAASDGELMEDFA